MAKVDIAAIVSHPPLEADLKLVLKEMFAEVSDEKVDAVKLFRAFRDRIDWHFRHSREVPDTFVEGIKEK